MRQILIFILFIFCVHLSFSQQQANNTSLFWDTSLSMKDRDLEKDFSILDKVFQRTPNQEVQLVLFNIATEERNYTVTNGDWSAIKKDLEAVTYDGANVYELLDGLAKYPNTYIFTDGNRVYEGDLPALPAKGFIINSSPYRDLDFLNRTALLNRNRLMDFAAILPENIGQFAKKGEPGALLIKGKVYVDNLLAAGVSLAVKGMPGTAVTGADGGFELTGQVGDSLLVSSRPHNTYKNIAIEGTDELSIFMEGNIVSLDEVILVEQKARETKEVNTAYGKENEEKIGYAVQSLDDEDITAIQTDVSQAVLNKFSNVTLRNDEDLSRATMRSNTSILGNNYGLVVIDGVPQRQSDSSRDGVQQFAERQNSQTGFDYVNPDNIASISVLKGYAATNKYGSLGANGVILITTKSAAGATASGAPIDRARLTDNVYSGAASNTTERVSIIQKKLQSSSSVEEAYKIYLQMRDAGSSEMRFFYDSFEYFATRSKEKAALIISSVMELFPNDMSTLRGVALALSSVGYHNEVIRINQEILLINKNNVQSYLDIAKATASAGDPQKSVELMLALERGQKYPTLNTTGISKTLKRDLKNLVFQEKNKINVAQLPNEFLNNVKYNVRLVFEWNDSEAEFNLQFVNPQNRYFNWEHNSMTNVDRMKDEIINGYSSEEFEFYGEGVQGKWILNATYLDHLDTTNREPFVLKCSLYQNFGYPDQSLEEIVLHFNAPGETRQIKTIQVK